MIPLALHASRSVTLIPNLAAFDRSSGTIEPIRSIKSSVNWDDYLFVCCYSSIKCPAKTHFDVSIVGTTRGALQPPLCLTGYALSLGLQKP